MILHVTVSPKKATTALYEARGAAGRGVCGELRGTAPGRAPGRPAPAAICIVLVLLSLRGGACSSRVGYTQARARSKAELLLHSAARCGCRHGGFLKRPLPPPAPAGTAAGCEGASPQRRRASTEAAFCERLVPQPRPAGWAGPAAPVSAAPGPPGAARTTRGCAQGRPRPSGHIHWRRYGLCVPGFSSYPPGSNLLNNSASRRSSRIKIFFSCVYNVCSKTYHLKPSLHIKTRAGFYISVV